MSNCWIRDSLFIKGNKLIVHTEERYFIMWSRGSLPKQVATVACCIHPEGQIKRGGCRQIHIWQHHKTHRTSYSFNSRINKKHDGGAFVKTRAFADGHRNLIILAHWTKLLQHDWWHRQHELRPSPSKITFHKPPRKLKLKKSEDGHEIHFVSVGIGGLPSCNP